MKDEALTEMLPRALLVLRITLGLFLLQWGIENFVVPQNTSAIWSYFYGLSVPQALSYVFGAAEIAIAGCSSSALSAPSRTVRRSPCIRSACLPRGANSSTPGATRLTIYSSPAFPCSAP